MALKSTVFKVELTISDVTRNHYEDRVLTLARHPSETDLRMLLRVVVFAMNAHERLQFTKGLADVDEPDLWQLGLTGDIEHWIELGQPTDKRIRQSCGRSDRVSIYTYNRGGAALWFGTVKDTAERFDHLAVTHLAVADESPVAALVDRNMKLSCLVEDDHVLLSSDAGALQIDLEAVKQASAT